MAGLLLSGPAGGGKSQAAAALRAQATRPTVIADFQAVYVAIAAVVRGADGSYPLREAALLPIVEHTRRAIIDAAVARDIDVIATNSDGDTVRREFLRDRLGGVDERVIDPGRDVVTDRLRDPITGDLDPECDRAIGRWYDRLD